MAALRRLSGLVLAMVALGTGVAACGDDDDQPAAASDSGEARPLESVEIGVGGHVISFAPLYIAQQAGYFEDEGISEVKFVQLQGGAAVIAAVASGDIFIGASGGTDIVGAAAKDQPVRLTGLFMDRLANVIAMSKEFMADRGIDASAPLEEKVQSLKGATIAAGGVGTGGYVFVSELLKEHGLDPKKDVKLVGLPPEPAAHLTALTSGNVDGSALSPPTVNIIESEGVGVPFINPITEDMGRFSNLSNHALLSSTDSLTDPRERATLEAVLRAVVKAAAMMRDQPDEGRKLIVKEFADLDPAVVGEAYDMVLPGLPDAPFPTEEMVDASLELVKAGDPNAPQDKTFEDIADPGPAKAAYEAASK